MTDDTIRAALRVLCWAWSQACEGIDIDGDDLQKKMIAEGLVEPDIATEAVIESESAPGWEFMEPGDTYYCFTPAFAAAVEEAALKETKR